MARGVYTIVDKDNVLKCLENKNFNLNIINTLNEERFLNLTNQFWFLSFYIAKQALRNNLWTAKSAENDLRDFLLELIEWYEKMNHSDDYDTWYGGKFIGEWANSDIIDSIKNIFTGYSKEEILKGVKVSMQLFKKLSLEIKENYNFDYPYKLMESVISWIDDCTNVP